MKAKQTAMLLNPVRSIMGTESRPTHRFVIANACGAVGIGAKYIHGRMPRKVIRNRLGALPRPLLERIAARI